MKRKSNKTLKASLFFIGLTTALLMGLALKINNQNFNSKNGLLSPFVNISPSLSPYPPTTSQPANQTVLQNQTGVTVTWTILDQDNTTGLYFLLYDESIDDYLASLTLFNLPTFRTWTNNTPITVDADTSTPGWHNITIFFTDMTESELFYEAQTSGNISGDASVAWIYVLHPPVINTPDIMKVHTNDTVNFSVVITDVDSTNGTLNITSNGSLVAPENTAWTNNSVISIPINSTVEGYFNYTVVATDGNYTLSNGYLIQKETLVWIADDFPPEIQGAEDIEVSLDITDVQFNITIRDVENSTGNYTILKNGAIYNISYVNATWSNNTLFYILDDNLTETLTTYTIIAEDLAGLNTTKNFSVYRNAPPVIIAPPDKIGVIGDPTEILNWTIQDIDDANGTYTIYKDFVAIQNGNWQNNTQFGEIYLNFNYVVNNSYRIVISDGISTREHTMVHTVNPGRELLKDSTIQIIITIFIATGLLGMGFTLKKKS